MKNKKDRFKSYNGYLFDKRIFQISVLVLIVFFSLIVFINGVEPRYYFNCDSPLGCELQSMQEFCVEPSQLDKIKYPGRYDWLQSCGLCSGGKVPQGFVCGEKPGFLQGSESVITILIIILAFLINHFWHNRKYKIDREEWEI